MKSHPLNVIVLALSLGLTSIANGQDPHTPEFITQELDQYIERSLEAWKVPGLAVCIIKDGQVVVSKGYGVKQYGKQEKVDKHTLFALGSNTKAFTATALAGLAYEGKCSLDDKVQQWLPTFKLLDPYVSSHLNLQDLISHRSGLGRFQGDFIFYDSDLTKELIYQKLSQFPLKTDFRSYGYTNVGYFLIGEVMQAVSGRSWSDYLAEKIFSPLNMRRTLAIPSKFLLADNRSHPHTLQHDEIISRPMGNSDIMAAAGGISSSVNDLSNWLIAQLDSGRLDGKSVIPWEVISMVREPQTLIGRSGPPYTLFNSSNFENYASGWYNLDYEGVELITHNGGIYGFTSSITLIPSHNLGIAILTNSDKHLLFESLKLEIIDAYFGLPFRDYSTIGQGYFKYQEEKKNHQLTIQAELAAVAPAPELPLETYAGLYKEASYGEISIDQEGKFLTMQFQHHPDLEGKLEFIAEGKFLCTFNQAIYGIVVIPFKIKDGEVRSLELSVDENVEPYSYLFKKVK